MLQESVVQLYASLRQEALVDVNLLQLIQGTVTNKLEIIVLDHKTETILTL